MALLRKILSFGAIALVAHGCASPADSLWRTDEQLSEYRQRGGIEVSSVNGLYNGIVEIVPTNKWKTVSFQQLQYCMQIPERIFVSDAPDWNGLSLYIIHSRYPDARYGAQVIVRRKTKERYEEDLDRAKRGKIERVKTSQMDAKDADLWEWQHITFHSTGEVDECGTLYRRDIRCANGDVLCIRGDVEKLIDRKTGRSLYPEMDAVVRRIINSIEPLN